MKALGGEEVGGSGGATSAFGGEWRGGGGSPETTLIPLGSVSLPLASQSLHRFSSGVPSTTNDPSNC